MQHDSAVLAAIKAEGHLARAAKEAEQFLAARGMGADGVQTNQPELIVATAGLKVKSRLEGRGVEKVCLVNSSNGMASHLVGVTLFGK